MQRFCGAVQRCKFRTGIAQLLACLTAEREVVGSIPRATLTVRVLKWLRNESNSIALQMAKPSRGSDDYIVWFQKISIPLLLMVLPIRPPQPVGIFVPEGSCITPHPPGISCFPFHGLYLSHLEIIDRVPLKINCSHLKAVFYNLWPICNLLQGNLYFLRWWSMLDNEQSLFFNSPSSEMHEARKQRLICFICHLKKTFTVKLQIWTIHWNKTMWTFSNFKTNLLTGKVYR